MNFLTEGDVIELKSGHTVYVRLPMHFVYANRKGVFDELAETEVTIGHDKLGMNTDWLAGRYIVTATGMQGGGTGHGPHDVYPDGHHVTAEKIPADGIDGIGQPRTKVSFYQSGAFTAMIRDIRPIGRARAKWELEPEHL